MIEDREQNIVIPLYSAGVDEVGRGALAGPVVAGAVIFDPEIHIQGLKDSKKCTAEERESLADEIWRSALACGIGMATASEIDDMNILNASHVAMQRAVESLSPAPKKVYVDGRLLPDFEVPAVAIIRGDQRVREISAGSIIAKVERDRMMEELDLLFPDFGWKRNKGYPTKEHLNALKIAGPVSYHRMTFRPVRENMIHLGNKS